MLHSILTWSRVVIAPFTFIAIMNKAFYLAACFIIYAIISDGLDGYIARKIGQATPFGALQDVFADKIFINIVAIGLCSVTLPENSMLRYTVSIWIIRDTLLTILWNFSKNAFKSLYIGKLYTVLQFCFLLAIVFMQIFQINISLFVFLAFIMFFAISLVTIIDYFKLMFY